MDNFKNKDFQFFVDNQVNFFKKYGYCFIAIKNQKVLGAYKDVDEAINETAKTEQLGTFIVQECTGEISSYLCTNMRFCIS